jgi:hypothetical protein
MGLQMDKIISLLQSLTSLNKVASVSVPGLVAAIALTLIWWPPRPIDKIPMLEVSQPANPQRGCIERGILIVQQEEACTAKWKTLDIPKGLSDFWSTERKNQCVLDQAKQKVAKCIEIETSRKGCEKTQNDYLALDIADLQKLLSATLDVYSSYEKTNNPLAGQFLKKARDHEDEISGKRELILKNEQSMRDRDLYLAELARYDKIISDRLADPGRLRPRKTFDDLLASLVNHVVAFILLAITLGVIGTPLSQFISAFSFDFVFPEGY